MKIVRTRYAPSPTGYMHLGNLKAALNEYLVAKSLNGKFVLRIEDTDQKRKVEGAIEVVYSTLKLAGIVHDEGPDIGGEFGPYTQSERLGMYMSFAKQLVKEKKAYYCFCTPERLETLRKEDSEEAMQYDRHCLVLSDEEINKNLADKLPFVIRQLIPEGTTTFKDEVFGEITVNNSELDDQILIKSDGFATYNFANVIDDHTMDITHVIRGAEYLSSTPKYNLLYTAFGWEIPVYVHVPLLLNEHGAKISKRKGDKSFQELLNEGYLPEAMVNYIALLGWSPEDNREIFSMSELIENFKISGLSKAPASVDAAKMAWMNGEYFKLMDKDRFYEMAKETIKECISRQGINHHHLAELCRTRIEFIHQIPELIGFIERLPEYDTDMYVNKKMKTDKANSLDTLKLLAEFLKDKTDFTSAALYQGLSELAAEKGIKNSVLLWPLRTALSGKQSTPCGATELCEILDLNESLFRINDGIRRLS